MTRGAGAAARGSTPKVPRDLETICLKCLQKEPRAALRHGRASWPTTCAASSDGEPIQARPVGAVGAGLAVVRRNPAGGRPDGGGGVPGGGAAVSGWLASSRPGRRRRHDQEQGRAERGARRSRRRAAAARAAGRAEGRYARPTGAGPARAWQSGDVGLAKAPPGGCHDGTMQGWRGIAPVARPVCSRASVALAGHAGGVRQRGVQSRRRALASAGDDKTVGSGTGEDGRGSSACWKGTPYRASVWRYSPDGAAARLGRATTRGSRCGTRRRGRYCSHRGGTPAVHARGVQPRRRGIASGMRDWTVKVWDAETGQGGAHPRGPTPARWRSAPTARASPRAAATAVKVWDAWHGGGLLCPRGTHGEVHCVAYSPDGTPSPRGARTGRSGCGTRDGGELLSVRGTPRASVCGVQPRTARASPRGVTKRDDVRRRQRRPDTGLGRTDGGAGRPRCSATPERSRASRTVPTFLPRLSHAAESLLVWNAGAEREGFGFTRSGQNALGVAFSPTTRRSPRPCQRQIP